MNQERILEKIKKCMALAQSANTAEASIALRQAQKLMETHGLTEESVALSDVSTEEVTYGSNSKPAGYMCALSNLVGTAFAVDQLLSYDTAGRPVFKFVGIGSAPELATYSFTVLRRQLVKARTAYLRRLDKRLKKSTKTRRADLFAGAWVSEVRSTVVAFAQTEEEKALIEQYKRREFGELGTHNPKWHEAKRNDYKASVAGRIAAEGVTLNHGLGAGDDVRRLTRC